MRVSALKTRRPASKLSCVLALSICLACAATPARSDERPGSGAWLIGLETQQRTFDTMSAGDARPVSRGDVGVRLSIDRLLTPHWALGLSGHFGGTWFDWSDEIYNIAGRVQDIGWDARLGVDRVMGLGPRALAFVGAGVEYGEARSWVNTLGVQQNIADEGPRTYMTGGYLRAGVVSPVWRRTALCAQISESFYGASASDPPFGTQFNWLGRSLAVSVGLRFVIAHGRATFD